MFGVDLIFRFGGTGKDFNPTINFQIFFDDISGSWGESEMGLGKTAGKEPC